MKQERAKELINNFSDKRILVIGDVMIDRYIHGDVERLNPEAPVPVLHAKEEVDLPGGASNVAKNAVSLGASAVLIGVVGEDRFAEKLQEKADEEGYSANFVVDEKRPTITKVRYMVNAQQMLRVDWEETHDVSSKIAKKIASAVAAEIKKGVNAIVVSDYAKGTITKEVAEDIMKQAGKKNVPVIVDVKPSRINYFVGAVMITPNLKEAHEYLGFNHLEQEGKSLQELGQALKEKFDTDVYITAGAHGVHICSNDVCADVPHEHRPALINPSGAGDVSVSTMCLVKLAGGTPEEVAGIANASCAVFIQKLENVGTTKDELLNVMENGLEKVDE